MRRIIVDRQVTTAAAVGHFEEPDAARHQHRLDGNKVGLGIVVDVFNNMRQSGRQRMAPKFRRGAVARQASRYSRCRRGGGHDGGRGKLDRLVASRAKCRVRRRRFSGGATDFADVSVASEERHKATPVRREADGAGAERAWRWRDRHRVAARFANHESRFGTWRAARPRRRAWETRVSSAVPPHTGQHVEAKRVAISPILLARRLAGGLMHCGGPLLPTMAALGNGHLGGRAPAG